jgi:hypothetical protein
MQIGGLYGILMSNSLRNQALLINIRVVGGGWEMYFFVRLAMQVLLTVEEYEL